MPEAVIVSSVRTPVGKAPKGALRTVRPDDLAATAIRGALARVPNLDPSEIDDVVLGCATPEAEQGLNVARVASRRPTRHMLRDDHQPLLLLWPTGHRTRRQRNRSGLERSPRRRRYRIH